MGRAFIGLGSNLGDGRQNLREAWRRLGEQAGIALLALSCPYLTKPIAKPEWLVAGRLPGAQFFTNGVGMIDCCLPPRELLAVMQTIETGMGRKREQTVDRPIDLDLLYYDELLLDDGELVLPHPEIQNRRFVLAPLTEVAPEHVHPRLGLTSRQMLAALPAEVEGEMQRLSWINEAPSMAKQSDIGGNL
ncbi:MAG TPA: 2-amino-4-hydroxy-6-hydroxymethyldihydropteridine diphosphokinase [Desulfurivibrionaceae bacterium]|nr:2-amino-4-hydroxy-6-hydroxymethyldihydropteridine diphosphokinase [Desulfurivibrionaceae bacterium]